MEQLIEFAGNHLMLVAALGVILALLVQNLVSDFTDSTNLTPQQATALINQEEAIVVDIRPIKDFSTGHIIRAINLPLNSLKNQQTQLEKYRGRPIIIACRSGNQSPAACKQLQKQGFDRVYNLKGGLIAWQSANLPVSKKRK